jgi:excisionase family DNA binding protein
MSSGRDTCPLPPLEGVDALRPDELPAFLAGLAALQGRAAARMAAESSRRNPQTTAAAELLTVPEVATRLRVPRQHAYELARRGDLASVRFGKYVRVRQADLEAWIARHREQS